MRNAICGRATRPQLIKPPVLYILDQPSRLSVFQQVLRFVAAYRLTMAFGWCTGTKSVRTHSTNLDAKDLPQHQQAGNTQAHTLSSPAHSSFVKLDVSSTVAGYVLFHVSASSADCQPMHRPTQLFYRQASNGAQTYSTPTSVLDTNTTPDPLRDHPRYVKVAELGLGSSAFVLLAEDKQRMKDVAIKFINRGSNRFESPAAVPSTVSSPLFNCDQYAMLL